MKKSAYLFFGCIAILLLLPFLCGWVYPRIQHVLHTQEEQVEQINALTAAYLEETQPAVSYEITEIKYSLHAQLYYVYLQDSEEQEFYIIFPEALDAMPTEIFASKEGLL